MHPVRVERYFESVFGFPERDYATTKRLFLSRCRCEAQRGRERCVFSVLPNPDNSASAQELSSGWHSTPFVSELRSEVRHAVMRFEEAHPGYLDRVRAHFAKQPSATATSTGKWTFPLRLAHVVGVSREQHLQYPGAVFQAASQFNLLEFIAPTVTPEEGVSGYVFDATQGPDCAVACFPGTAYRNYLLHPDFVHDGYLAGGLTDNQGEGNEEAAPVARKPRPPRTAVQLEEARGQRADHQIDMLQDITRFLTGGRGGRAGCDDIPTVPYDEYYRIQNGYFQAARGKMEGLTGRLDSLASFFQTSRAELLDRLTDMLRIGVVEEATVTCGVLHSPSAAGGAGEREADKGSAPPRQLHTVWQTYNSALSLSGGRAEEDSTATATLAQCVLNGTYEATLLVGVQRTLQYLDEISSRSGGATLPDELPPVFLTKVGGGVFHNKATWIAAAIQRAMRRVTPLQVPLDIRLVHYRTIDPQYTSLLE